MNAPASPPTTSSAFVRQAMLLVAVSAAAGAAVGGLRWVVSFLPGMQGLLFGGALGFGFGVLGRGQTTGPWRPGPRFWLWLNVTLTFTAAMLAMVSMLHAPALAGPLDWLSGVVRGTAGEDYFGPVPLNPQEGQLSSGGWIFFNLLDLVFFFLLGLLTLGVSATKGEPEGPEVAAGAEVPAPGDEVVAAPIAPGARRLFLIQWGLLALAGIVAGVWIGRDSDGVLKDAQSRTARIAELHSLAGRYEFDDGRHLLSPPGQVGAFVLKPMGYDVLVGLSDPEGVYVLRLEHRGRRFVGRLERGGLPVPLRVRFEPDGRLRLAGRVHLEGGSAMDVLVKARQVAP